MTLWMRNYPLLTHIIVVSSLFSIKTHKQTYTAKMKASGKPVSPHVLIYAFPVVAISSITNRVTGAALSVGCAGLGLLELVGGSGTSLWVMETIGSQGFIISSGAKFGVSFTILYHYLGAVRHTLWDYYPDMLTNTEVEKSSYLLLGGATALSGLTIFF